MQPDRTERRLAAILFADIVGYGALMAEDEERGLRVRERIVDIVRARVAEHGGSLAEVGVDETVSTFPTALGAVSCAVAIQERLRGESLLVVRIGVHHGDLGAPESEKEATNLAAAIALTAAPSGIRVSAAAFEELRGRLEIGVTDLGPLSLARFPEPVHVYAIHVGGERDKPAPIATPQRRLAAILEADVVSYSRLMATHEDSTVRTVTRYRGVFVDHVRQHAGRIIDTSGDGVLAELGSAVEAVRCAVAIQENLRERNATLSPASAVRFRIGIDVGDVRVEGNRIYGSGVNVAARLEALAPPGGLCVSGPVHEQVRYHIDRPFADLGERKLKNIPHSVHAYALALDGSPPRGLRVRARAHAAIAAALGTAVLAIAAAAYLTYGARSRTEAGAPLTSIAVLPFDDMSPAGDQKWLADGMAEELIETLSRIEALRVPARTSAFALRGKDIGTIGAELRVGSVVEGSVRRSDDQLRVTAQLIRVSDGYHLWSARYDRKLSDVFAIQSEIARAIAEAIRREFGIEYQLSWLQNAHEPSDVRAYELYKTGYWIMWPLLTEEGIRKGIEYFEQALAIDPDYAQARVELGFAHVWRSSLYARAETDLPFAKAQAERVLATDARNGGAHNLLAWVFQGQREWQQAQRVVERGLAHNPAHSALLSQSGVLLALHGRPAEALVAARRAVDLDPRFAPYHFGLGSVEILAREFQAAVADLERAWELGPGFPSTRAWLSLAYHLSGRDTEALEAAVRELPPELSGLESAMRQGFDEAGFPGAVRARHEWLTAKSGARCSDEALWGGDPLATLGEPHSVFECLANAIDRGDLLYLKANPVYDPYRSDPRFTALLRRMNLAE